MSFFSIGFISTVVYIFNKQIKSNDDKLDFFKTSFAYRVFEFCKKVFIRFLSLSKNIPLVKRIIGLAIICIVVNVSLIIIAIEGYSVFIAIVPSILSIGGFAYYIVNSKATE